MKKLIHTSGIYCIAAICAGVFFREFTKFNGFTGTSALGFMHVHLFVLGMAVYLILALFSMHGNLTEQKTFHSFSMFYNAGVIGTVTMLLIRGIIQVLNLQVSAGMSAAVSGIAGLFHILLCVGFWFLFKSLKNMDVKA